MRYRTAHIMPIARPLPASRRAVVGSRAGVVRKRIVAAVGTLSEAIVRSGAMTREMRHVSQYTQAAMMRS